MPAPAQLARGEIYERAREEARKEEWDWLFDPLRDWFDGLWSWIQDIGQSIVDTLGDAIEIWINAILNTLGTILDVLGDAIASVGDLLGDVAGWILEQVATVGEIIVSTLGSAIEGLGSWIVDAFSEVVGVLRDVLGAIWDGLVAGVTAVWEWLRDNILGPLWDALSDFFERVVDMIVSAAETVFNAVVSMVTPGSPLEPSQALVAFGAVSAAVMGASLVITTINLAHPLKTIVGEQMTAFIYKFLGFNELSSAFWGSIGAEVLDYPMRLWARLTFRSRVPGHSDADEMLWHGQITKEEWFKIHTYEGWKDEYIQAHYASMWHNPSVREIGMITDAVALEPEKITEMLRELGYKPEALPMLSAVLARRPTVDELKTLRSELIKDTVDGAMSIADLERALRQLGATVTELELLRQIVEIKIARAERKAAASEVEAWQGERVKALTEAYRRDLLTEVEYLEELEFAGVEHAKASQTVYLEEVRKLPKLKRTAEPVETVSVAGGERYYAV